MVRFRRLVILPAAMLLPLAAAAPASASRTSVVPRHVAGAPRQVAAAPTYTVGVDNASPAGHNFEYTDFFPNTLTAHAGDVIDFTWNQGSADGFHTVSLFHGTSSPAAYPFLVPDNDDPGQAPQINPAILGPSANALGCGATAASPCVFDGSAGGADLNSGAQPTGLPQPNHFIVQLKPGLAAGTYNYACLIHPGRMNGTITVTTGQADSVAQVAARAAGQYATSSTAALAAEAAANTTTATKNPNGTNTWSATAGTAPASQPVEVLEMLPANIPVQPGDSVKWTTNTQLGNEIHTVTFPDAATVANPGPVNATNPIPFLCENGSLADPVAPGGPPPNFGCAAPAENGWIPGPQGATSIATGSTVGSSGLISNPPFGPLTNNYTYTFPKNGSFSFMCHIHAHMFGTVFTQGYRSVASDGGIFTHGNQDFFGSQGGKPLNAPIVGAAPTPDQQGYYEVAADGGIFTFGDAVYQGSMGGKHLNKPIVGMGVTPDGGGYYEVASDGGIFTFGDATFQGSMGGNHLNKPVVGMAVTPTGLGYYEVASDGGIFTFGDAGFQGSEGGTVLNKPIVGMASTSDGGGYWEVASDGGIFTFGTAGFFGSEGAIKLNKPIVGMQATTDDGGYRLVATDGGIFTHGDATFAGSEGATPLTLPVVGIMGS